MRVRRLQRCEARFVAGWLGVMLLLGCGHESPPQLTAPLRALTRSAASSTASSPAVVSSGVNSPAAAPAAPAAPVVAVSPPPSATATAMVTIPAGRYRPFFPGKDEPAQREVAAFRLDVTPVTAAQFAAFVWAHPQWRRSAVARIFADTSYLRLWRTDLDPGLAPTTVVTHVSWFAARAYCRALGRRLPVLKEWERAALASATVADGRADPGFSARILRWYGLPARGRPAPVGQHPANFFGVRDLHGLVWEWVEDFNTALVTGESRADAALERGLYCGAGSIGAADPSDYAAFMRFALRSSLRAAYTTGSLGFRCAADVVFPESEGGSP